MVSLYQGGLTCYEIAARLGRTGRAVLNVLEDAHIPRRDSSRAQKRWGLREDYFATIDTPIKAYLLGVIYADGNVYHNRFKLAMWAIDEPFLLATARELGFDGPLYWEQKRGPKRQDMVSLTIYSRVFVDHLRDKGVIDNKTNRLTFPSWLKDDLKVHFVHGLLDGDGCICVTHERATGRLNPDWRFCTSFAGCYVVMEGLHDWFLTQGLRGHLRHNEANPLSGRLSFNGTKALQSANLIYANAQPLHLTRKRDKYRTMVNTMNDTRSRRKPQTHLAVDEGLRILSV